MEITEELKEKLKEEKVMLNSEITAIKRSMADYKAERKLEWKSFKNKFNDDMDEIKKSLKNLNTHHKK